MGNWSRLSFFQKNRKRRLAGQVGYGSSLEMASSGHGPPLVTNTLSTVCGDSIVYVEASTCRDIATFCEQNRTRNGQRANMPVWKIRRYFPTKRRDIALVKLVKLTEKYSVSRRDGFTGEKSKNKHALKCF
jgi:hypothetical protein